MPKITIEKTQIFFLWKTISVFQKYVGEQFKFNVSCFLQGIREGFSQIFVPEDLIKLIRFDRAATLNLSVLRSF